MFKAHDIAKKQHRERAQPQSRKKWGLLEKKKDYRLRAQDYHRKEAHLALLRSKASQANKDEFNFKMIKAKTKDGVLVASRGAEVLNDEQAKLFKTQDAGYLRTLINNEQSKIDKAKATLLAEGSGKHTVFVEDEDELENFDAAKHFDTDRKLLHRRQNRLRNDQLKEVDIHQAAENSLKDLQTLQKRLNRREELDLVQQELALQRELMKKGDKKKIVNKDGTVTYKWKKVRKR